MPAVHDRVTAAAYVSGMAEEMGWRRFLRRRAVAVLVLTVASWMAVVGLVTFLRRLADG